MNNDMPALFGKTLFKPPPDLKLLCPEAKTMDTDIKKRLLSGAAFRCYRVLKLYTK